LASDWAAAFASASRVICITLISKEQRWGHANCTTNQMRYENNTRKHRTSFKCVFAHRGGYRVLSLTLWRSIRCSVISINQVHKQNSAAARYKDQLWMDVHFSVTRGDCEVQYTAKSCKAEKFPVWKIYQTGAFFADVVLLLISSSLPFFSLPLCPCALPSCVL